MIHLLKKYSPLVCALTLLTLQPSPCAQNATTSRVPATILQSEHADILLSEGRMALEQPLKTLNFMGLRDGDRVADIGCGNGFYSLQVAQRVAPTGRVLAVDVQQGMLDQLIARRDEAGLKNIDAILGAFDDPRLPTKKMDWILLVDAYHEFSEPGAMLNKMKASLAPGGRVALLEYRAEQDPATIPFPIPRDHKMSVEEVMREWTAGGFELVTRVDFLPAQHLFIFKVADDSQRTTIRPLIFKETPNVSTYDNRVYFAGQPSSEGFADFAALGIKTVINLRTDGEVAALDFDEAKLLEESGVNYLHIPMGGALPKKNDLQKIMGAIDTHRDAPVLIHCASSGRVGGIWSYYVATQEGLSVEEAIAEGQAAGMRSSGFADLLRKTLATP